MSVSRSDRDPAVLARDRPEQGTVGDPPEPQPGLEQGDRAGVGARAPADLDLAPAGLAADGEEGALGEDFDPAGAVLGLVRATIEPNDLGTAQTAGEADRENGPVAQATQIHVQRRQHRQKLVGEDRGLLQGRASVPAADAGQHGGDMAVADVERLAELPVAPGDAGQPPLEGRDRKLRAAALDLRREVEADRFRIGRRLREALAAQPGGELAASRRRRRAGCCRLAPSGRRPWRSPPSRPGGRWAGWRPAQAAAAAQGLPTGTGRPTDPRRPAGGQCAGALGRQRSP